MIKLGVKDDIISYVYEKEDLENMTTEQLVSFIRHITIWHSMYFRDWHYEDDYESRYKEYIDKYVCVHETWPENYPTEYYWSNEDDLRAILKTRPNIPNKIQKKKALKEIISENKKKTKRNLKYKR